MKDWNRICPSHWKSDKTHRAEGRLEGSVVARCFIKSVLIISDVRSSIPPQARPANWFRDEFSVRQNSRMLDGDCVERFKTMDYAQRGATLLEYGNQRER